MKKLIVIKVKNILLWSPQAASVLRLIYWYFSVDSTSQDESDSDNPRGWT